VPQKIDLMRSEVVMSSDPKKIEPEIMPPVPEVEPQRRPQEIPQDKDAPQKEAPPTD
jgi:hypothetical protein